MTYNDLYNFIDAQLPGTLTIQPADLTATVDDLIDYCYDGVSIVINSANKVENSDKEITTVSGTSDYLDVPEMSVTAVFSIDGNGDVQKVTT